MPGVLLYPSCHRDTGCHWTEVCWLFKRPRPRDLPAIGGIQGYPIATCSNVYQWPYSKETQQPSWALWTVSVMCLSPFLFFSFLIVMYVSIFLHLFLPLLPHHHHTLHNPLLWIVLFAMYYQFCVILLFPPFTRLYFVPLFFVCFVLETIYSGASLNGPSEKRITSQQRTYLQERNDFP